MNQFKYEAKKGAALIKGILTADSQNDAIEKINRMGLIPVEVIDQSKPEQALPLKTPSIVSDKVKPRAMSVFYRQLQKLLKSGITLMPALVIAEQQTEDGVLRGVLSRIKSDVREGSSLSKSLSLFPQVFSRFATAMIEVGEQTGQLDQVLERVASSCEREHALVSKIRQALIYPGIVLGLGFLAVIFLLATVVPQFAVLFDELGQNLPLVTRMLITVSLIVQKAGIWILVIGAALFFFVKRSFQTSKIKVAFDALWLKTPYLGTVLQMTQLAMFSRAMQMLLGSGISLIAAFRIASPVVSNSIFQDELAEAEKVLEQGGRLSRIMRKGKFFPLFATHLLVVGEETGTLAGSFSDIADWYEQQAEENLKVMTQLVEPIAVAVVGLLLGLVAMAVLLPVFTLEAVIS